MNQLATRSPELPEEFHDLDALRRDACQEAVNVRQAFWRKSFPVDPVKIALALGAEVYEAQLGTDIFGALLQSSDQSMRIYIDKDQPASRYRFSAAHELGHYVDRSRRLDVLPRDIDRRSDKMPDFKTPEGKREIWANEFAGELLMPLEEIKRQYASGNTSPVRLSKLFNVSLPAMNYRLRLLRNKLS
jgi:putative toxin-antitoxin system, toxin component